MGGVALFAASGSSGRELFRTDGTANGTYQVADIFAGGSSSNPTNLTVFGNRVLFQASNAANGAELWITDGTAAGTQMLADTNAGSASGSPNYLAVIGSKAVFTVTSPTGSELWVTDGTALGTTALATAPIANAFRYQTAIGDKAVFMGFDTTRGRELWSTDGTVAGTAPLVDIFPGIFNGRPHEFTQVGNQVVFTATDPNGSAVWRTDGTAAGTTRLGSTYPGFDAGSLPIVRGRGQPGTRINALNGRTLFVAAADTGNGGIAEDRVLWTTGGSAASTFPLLSSSGTPITMVHNRDAQDGLNSYPMFTLGQRMLFTAFDTTRGFELWVTDGLSGGSGTAPLLDLYPGTGGSYATNFGSLDANHMLFNARTQNIGYELWITDGTAAGTVMVRDINPNPGESSLPRNLTLLSGTTTVFFAQDGSNPGLTLWRSDGTTAGTTAVKNVSYTETRRLGGPLTVMGGRAFFAGDDGVGGQQLWVSDGTTAGTNVLATINPTGASRPAEMTVIPGSKIIFAADNGTQGRELWITDGTTVGTTLLSDIVTGAAGSNPDNLATLGNNLLFAANDGVNGRELWITDGTTAGTKMLADINPGAGGSSPNGISVRNGLAFFQANNGSVGYELWATDGTAAGTRLVRNIATYEVAPTAGNMVAFNAPVFTPGVANLEITAKDATKAEGNTTSTNFTFTVTRSVVTNTAVSATFTITPLLPDPTAPDDFVGAAFPTGTVSFLAGETSKTVTVQVAGDTALERDEQFLVTLSAPTGGAVIARPTAHGTILDNDSVVSIAAVDAAKAEGNAGTTAFTFQVTRAGALGQAQSVNWAVKNGTTGAADFGGTLPSGSVSFASGETVKQVTVNVTGDTTIETDEQFQVTLSGPASGPAIGVATATGTILNDDAALSIARVKSLQGEGNDGSSVFAFTVTRTGLATGEATATWAVTGSGPVAANAADFLGGVLPSGTVTLNAGETTASIDINVFGDTTIEPDEGFTVTLSNPTGAALGTAAASMTIINDDATLAIAATSANQFEGNAGLTPFTFTVTRAGKLNQAASAKFTVTGGATNPADGVDFDGSKLPTGTVSFASGEASKVITVNVVGDTTREQAETFVVTLSNPNGAVITTDTATGTIKNDDTTLTIAPTSASQTEGASGTKGFTFTVTRQGLTTGASSASFAVTGAGTFQADAADFGGALPTGTVSFAAGETSKVITIGVSGDSTAEFDEGFQVSLSSPTGATIVTASALGTILDDDAIYGTTGNDALIGTVNADTFRIGAGLDSITALAGLDFLQWTPAALGAATANLATLMDFDPLGGETIDLSLIDANSTVVGNDAFTYIGNAKFSGTPGEVRWQVQGTDILVQGNVNANLTPELTILVKNFGAGDPGWFTL